MSPSLAGLAGLFVFAAAWEVVGLGAIAEAGRIVLRPGGKADVRDRLAMRFALGPRLERAGLAERVTPRAFAGAKLGSLVAAALLAGLAIFPGTPGRIGLAMIGGFAAAGFVAPDAWVERQAQGRRKRMVAALPDALDLVAVGVAAGRTPVALFAEVAANAVGPLSEELAITVASIDAGMPQNEALARLRQRTAAPELGSFGAAIERSRRYGSPLAEQLHAQAATLRAEEQRRLAESAARAAPKIQLVVAMVLVPSALLAIAAALVANSDALFAAI